MGVLRLFFDLLLLVALATTVLGLLGAMREVVLLRNEVRALTRLVTKPSHPEYLGDQVPRSLADAIPPELAATGAAVVVFVAPGCGGCDELLRRLVIGRAPQDRVLLVTTGAEDYEPLRAAEGAGFLVNKDATGALFEASEITATPALLAVDTTTGLAYDYVVGGYLTWIRSVLRPSRLRARAPKEPAI